MVNSFIKIQKCPAGRVVSSFMECQKRPSGRVVSFIEGQTCPGAEWLTVS